MSLPGSGSSAAHSIFLGGSLNFPACTFWDVWRKINSLRSPLVLDEFFVFHKKQIHILFLSKWVCNEIHEASVSQSSQEQAFIKFCEEIVRSTVGVNSKGYLALLTTRRIVARKCLPWTLLSSLALAERLSGSLGVHLKSHIWKARLFPCGSLLIKSMPLDQKRQKIQCCVFRIQSPFVETTCIFTILLYILL